MRFSYRLPAALIGATIIVAQPQFAVAQLSPQQVEAIGREVTVRIDGSGGGSGVIVDRKDNTYFVLTNHHVVRYPDRYEIETSDGNRYPIYKMQELPGLDLALVQFQSNKIYRVAELGNSDQLTGGANVYAAGFPVPEPQREQRTYRFAGGQFQRYQPAGDNGYTMVYNSEVVHGMSGGPVLDGVGRVVGINGRFCSGLRLGIPINSFLANKANLRQLQDSSADNTRSPSVEDLLNLGRAKTEKGDYQSAIRDYQRALQSCPDSPDAYYQIGAAQYGAGNKQAAIENFNQVIRINPRNADAYVFRGIVRSKQGDKQGAIADYNEAIRLNPNYANAYVGRGNVRLDQGDKQGAIADFNEAIRLNPNLFQPYVGRGNVRSQQGDKQGAIADFNEAIRLNPNSADGYLGRGNVRLKQGDKQGAIADYNEAIRLNPNYADAYDNRGLARRLQGDNQGAIEDHTQAIRLTSTNSNIAFSYNNRARAYSNLKDYQKAISDYNEAMRLNPNDFLAYFTRGKLRYDHLKDYQGSQTDFNEAIRISPNDADSYYFRGLTYQQQGDKRRAIDDFQKAANLYQQQGNSEWYKNSQDRIRELRQ